MKARQWLTGHRYYDPVGRMGNDDSLATDKDTVILQTKGRALTPQEQMMVRLRR